MLQSTDQDILRVSQMFLFPSLTSINRYVNCSAEIGHHSLHQHHQVKSAFQLDVCRLVSLVLAEHVCQEASAIIMHYTSLWQYHKIFLLDGGGKVVEVKLKWGRIIQPYFRAYSAVETYIIIRALSQQRQQRRTLQGVFYYGFRFREINRQFPGASWNSSFWQRG